MLNLKVMYSNAKAGMATLNDNVVALKCSLFWCISDTKSRSAFSVTRVLISEALGVFMLLVVQPCCVNKVSVNCDIVSYCLLR